MKNWQSILLPPSATIREVMRALDKGSLRIVLICDANQRLLGTVTDGDTRRALLADANMHDPVSLAMNINPISVSSKSTREQRLKLMRQHDLTAVPILDSNNYVLGLETIHQAMQPELRDNPVFLMAGGFGTRLQPLTDRCPKPMLRVGEKPILEHLVEQFIRYGFHNFYISTHYLPEAIRNHFGDGSKWGVSVQCIHEGTPLGTGAGGIILCRAETDGKRKIAERYEEFFRGSDYLFVKEPRYARSNYWLNAIYCPDKKSRNQFLELTNNLGIMTRPVWQLMHRLPMFKDCLRGVLIKSELAVSHMFNLPSSALAEDL